MVEIWEVLERVEKPDRLGMLVREEAPVGVMKLGITEAVVTVRVLLTVEKLGVLGDPVRGLLAIEEELAVEEALAGEALAVGETFVVEEVLVVGEMFAEEVFVEEMLAVEKVAVEEALVQAKCQAGRS